MKKVSICYLLFCLFSVSAFAQSKKSKNYVFSYFKGDSKDGLHLAYSNDGYHWTALKNGQSFLKPEVAADKLMRDPCIIRGGDGYFHMVWTVSWNDRGIGYAKSKDLINWSAQQFIPVMGHEENARNTWAPEITYDAKSKIYMIYWASTIKGLYPQTQSEKENAYNHRIYYVTTRDFIRFSDTKLLYDPGFNVIDATIVKDGKFYFMFMKDETVEPVTKDLKIAVSKKLDGPYTPASKPLSNHQWVEGPTVLRQDGEWLVYFDKYREKKYGAIKSKDLRVWEDVSDKISLPSCIRHGSILEVTPQELERLKRE
ncbi:glycoside hydrolase family 43 protein [Pseudopedobacter saltans]|uniref:glycoside hydrolase family 43 protein n=1 Tax=Pseudopedobacter saltans TaxID=151895 RepID=UPI0002ECE0D5|nr:glycoside hydrolase family 43 protein [Pseudopedobacter saltans]